MTQLIVLRKGVVIFFPRQLHFVVTILNRNFAAGLVIECSFGLNDSQRLYVPEQSQLVREVLKVVRLSINPEDMGRDEVSRALF